MARGGLPPVPPINPGLTWVPGIGWQRFVPAPPARRRPPTPHHRPLGGQPGFRMPWFDDRQRD